ncbi:hypothetical protein G6F60_015288 [Rhizopus arrhizus]|nr:hypothetical protein G6F60_015288 [Rhizopus arrhizus]
MADDEFQENLRPARAVDLGGECRQGASLDLPEQRAVLERAVDQHRDAVGLAGGQPALFGIARAHRQVAL